jgi:hypothetical protein
MAKDARLRRAVDRLKSTAETAAWPTAPAGAAAGREPSAARLAELESRLRRQEELLREIAEGLRAPPAPGTLAGAEVERIARAVAFVHARSRPGLRLVPVVLAVLLAAGVGTAVGAWQSERLEALVAAAAGRIEAWSAPW